MRVGPFSLPVGDSGSVPGILLPLLYLGPAAPVRLFQFDLNPGAVLPNRVQIRLAKLVQCTRGHRTAGSRPPVAGVQKCHLSEEVASQKRGQVATLALVVP